MTRTLYAGGWYVDARPSGALCVLYPGSHIKTHLGRVELPPGEIYGPLFLRCADADGFKFAGQAHDTLNPAAWEYAGGVWRALPPPCAGVSPLIYDHTGALHRSDGSIGSQGYRYVADDGTLVTGDETYTKPLPTGQLIHEYSAAGDLLIGQGHEDGVVVWDGTVLRLLEEGTCRFVRVQRDGEQVAVSWATPHGAVIIQTTLVELRALPPVTTSGTIVPNPGTPPPPPPPQEPPPVSLPDHLADVQRIRAQYPTPLGETHAAFLCDVARAVGGKLFKKVGGDHVFLPDGTPISMDVIIVPPYWVDVLGNAEAEAMPTWDVHENAGQPENWIDPPSPVTPPPNPPPPEPPKPPAPPADWLTVVHAVAELSAHISDLREQVQQQATAIDALTSAIKAQQPPPPAHYRNRFIGAIDPVSP